MEKKSDILKVEKGLFEELNNRLSAENLTLTVICAGGYVLGRHGLRTTQDIDGFYKSTKTIERLIRETGDKFGANSNEENWLNNSVQNLNRRPPENICEEVYRFSNLLVLVPPLDYIAGMKLESAREQDIQDVASIIQILECKKPEQLIAKITAYGFAAPDESVLLESFGLAYGMEWLENYFLENENSMEEKGRNSSST